MHINRRRWQLKPVMAPSVDPEFPHMDSITRATESWRYSILSLEFWLSPSGFIREWIRQVVRFALFLGAPVLLVVPLVTFLLASLLKWTVLITTIAWKLILLVMVFLVGGVVTLFNWLLLKTILSSRNIR